MYGQRSYRKFLRSTREILRIVYRVLVSPIVLLSRAFSWLVEVIETWWKERRLVNLLWGLPAVVLGGVTVYFALGHEADSRFVRAARYARRGDDLLKSGEYQTASLLLGRAVSLNPADNAAAFSLAKACSGAGDGSRALAILDRLAPPNGIGDPDAHLWRAKTILSRSNIGESDLQAAESHLLNALKVRTSDSEANALLGELYFQTQLFDLAAQRLGQAVEEHPGYLLMFAKAVSLTGNSLRARSLAESAESHFRRLTETDPRNLQARLQLADSLFFMERFDESLEVLKRGLETFPDEQSLKNAAANVLVRWSDTLNNGSLVHRQEKLTKLTSALAFNPNELLVFDRLNRLFLISDDVRQAGKSHLQQNITDGIAVAMSHLILGTIADSGSVESVFHLERAYEEFPSASVIINNLAWAISHSESPDLERALDLMNGVIQRDDGSNPAYTAQFQDTRGQILIALKRWREAISDLESALNGIGDKNSAHQGLAQAYDAIGLPEIAEQHRRKTTTVEQNL